MPDANNFTVGIMALVAQQEREMISKRTKEALAAAKARGVKLGCPNGAAHLRKYGNVQGVKAIKANANARAKSLRPVLAAIQENGIKSLNGIAQELNRQKIRTPRGGRWYPASVKRLLQRINLLAVVSC